MDIPTLPSKLPGYNLYIDGFQALRRPKGLTGSNITHIVSVLDWKFPQGWAPLRGFQHLRIPLDDVYDSNILEYFPRSNEFIHRALNGPRPNQSLNNTSIESIHGGVLVHCAMGVSRSATIVVAYLLWVSRQPASIGQPQASQKSKSSSSSSSPSSSPTASPPTPDTISLPPTPLTVDSALALIRECRPQVEPNSGFIKQLRMYEAMGCPGTQERLESHKIYRRWMNSRNVMDALSENRAPEMADISFRDEEGDDDDDELNNASPLSDGEALAQIESLSLSPQSNGDDSETTDPDITISSPSPSPSSPSPDIELKCRKCRRLLAKSTFIIAHKPPPHRDPSADPNNDSCAHIFLHPLSWMRTTLAQGELDGRLVCPNEKCQANIGKFAWQGLRCSCGGWVTPGFGIAKARVDEAKVVKRNARTVIGGPDSAVRLPPGMRKSGSGNL